MTKRVRISEWAETAFQTDWELWRARTNEGMVVLGKIPDGTFTLHRFNDEGGNIIHVSKEEALWLTLELAPERLKYV